MKNKGTNKIMNLHPLKEHRLSKKWYWMSTTVVILGLISAIVLYLIHASVERQKMAFEQVDAIMDVQNRTSTFHLWFEEALTTGTKEDAEKTFGDLYLAMKFQDALLSGGQAENGTTLAPLDPIFLGDSKRIRTELENLKELAIKRSENPKLGAIGSGLDKQFNSSFTEFEKDARSLEQAVETERLNDQAKERRLFFLLVIMWAVVVAGSALGLHGQERKRIQAEKSLETTYKEMEQRVQDRTVELRDANNQLRQSENEFRRLSKQFHTLLDAIPDSITLLSSDLRVLWANRCAVMAAKSPEVVGQPCFSVWMGANAPCEGCAVRRSFQTGKAEVSQTTSSNGRMILDKRAFPMRSDDGRIEGVIEIVADITEKTTLQAEAQRSAHLASIGELAAGVAHEINNPINSIINYAQIMIDESAGTDEDAEIPSRILKDGERIETIVKSLLSFAVQRKDEKRPASVHDILSDTLALSSTQFRKEGIIINVSLPPDLPGIVANSQQIQQVFLNIINNARYALNEKYPGPDDDKILVILGEETISGAGKQVKITFHDQGTGIPMDKINRVVDPFFTTKPQGSGTGLGLSICHGIVSDHGGRLLIQSVEGQYTKVQVLLPAAGQEGVRETAGRNHG